MFTVPSRIIPKNYRNITGKFSSKKSDRLLSYESKLERDFLYSYEFDNSIISIVEQPLTIEYIYENKNYKYTPDFYLKTPNNFNDIIVEVKYYDELKTTFAQSKRKYKAMVEYVKDKDVDFVFHTDRCEYISSDNYKFNIHFLLNYNDLNLNDYLLINKLYKPYITIQELLNKYSIDKYKQLSLISTIWCLIRRKIFIVDLYEKLTANTQLIQLRAYDEKRYQAHINGKINKGYLL